MHAADSRKTGLPPLFAWVRVWQRSTSQPILGFSYIDPAAGPSVKGRFIRNEGDPAQILRVLEDTNATFRMPGFEFEVVGDEEARSLGLPPVPGWYLESFDDGTRALFTDELDSPPTPLAPDRYLKVIEASGSPIARIHRCSGEPGPAPGPLDYDALERTARRGRLLAQMDRVAAWATDFVYAGNPDPDRIGCFIVRPCGSSWSVAFGRLAKDGSIFRTAYEAVGTGRAGWPFEVLVFDPPREDSGRLREAARAIVVGQHRFAFSAKADAYNVLVVREDNGNNRVYWYPASTTAGVEVIGADGCVVVREDGSAVVEPYHKALLRSEPGETWLVHSHLLVQEPAPLDVAAVWMRRPPSPSFVLCERWTYFISRRGAIVPVDLDGRIGIDDGLVAVIENALEQDSLRHP